MQTDFNIEVIAPDGVEVNDAEKEAYIKHINKNNPGRRIEWVKIEIDNEGYANLTYSLAPVDFERIRRITGYLVGTTNRWNNGKKAELRDRVNHSCSC